MDCDLDNFDFELYSVKNVKAVFSNNLKRLDERKVEENSSVVGSASNIASEKDDLTVNITLTDSVQQSDIVPEKDLPTGNNDDLEIVNVVKKRGRRKKSSDLKLLDVVIDNSPTLNENGRRRSTRISNLRAKRLNSSDLSVTLDDSIQELHETRRSTQKQLPTRKKKNKSDNSIQQVHEIVGLDEQNQLHIPKCVDILLEDELNNISDELEYNKDISVKIIWKTNMVKKFTIRQHQKLQTIFEQLAEQENVETHQIILMFKGVSVQHSDTPDSLGLKIVDFLDGGVVTGAVESSATSSTTPVLNLDRDTIRLVFRDSKQKQLKLTIGIDDKMLVVMTKCSEQLDLDLGKLKFMLDGDKINANDTPSGLGLEGDEIIEIIYL